MPTLSFPLSAVTLKSTWNCYQSGSSYVSSTPKKATNTQIVAISGIPSGATINSAVLSFYIESSPSTGASVSTINGTTVPYRPGTYTTNLSVTGNGDLPITFAFQAYGETHDHVQSHSSVLTFQNLVLTITYTDPYAASDWSINKTSVEAGGSVSVTISPKGSGYSHHIKAEIGIYSSEVSVNTNVNMATVPTELNWLYALPNSTSGTCTLTLTTYYNNSEVGTSSKTVTITVPANVVPSLTVNCSRVLSVGGVTYPDVTGGYVQQKSAVKAAITAADGAYGSTITGYSINVGGRTESAYNSAGTTITSPLLPMSGNVAVTFRVTDSRGRTAQTVQHINVEAYSPPKISNFGVKRVNESGTDDPNGTRGWYSFGKSFSSLGGKNVCTASITAAGSTAENIADSGWIVPGNIMTLNVLSTYQVQLTLRDGYESVMFEATIPSMNVAMHFSADGTAVWIGGTCEHSNAFGVESNREVYFYGMELKELIRSIVSEML